MSTELEVYQDQVAKLYIAFFGRAPEANGFNHWVDTLSNGATLTELAATFSQTVEFERAYGDATVRDAVSRFYENTLNREVDPEGLEFWVGKVNEGYPFYDIANAIIDTAFKGGPDVNPLDQALVQNKVTVAKYVAITLASNDFALAAGALEGVTADPASVQMIRARLDALANSDASNSDAGDSNAGGQTTGPVANPQVQDGGGGGGGGGGGPVAPAPIQGTANADTLTGTDGNDTIISGGGADEMTGGGGNDTFDVNASGTATITDLSTGDVLIVRSGSTAIANNVSAFVATAATKNEGGSATLNAATTSSTINLNLATVTTVATDGYTLNGGDGADSLTGSSADDTINGNGGDDTITGGTGADVINAGVGNNVITDAGVGEDTIFHTVASSTVQINATGSDWINVAALEDGATVTVSDDGTTDRKVNADQSGRGIKIDGQALTSGRGTYIGSIGADTITGGDGDDLIRGRTGADSLIGGKGNDVYEYLGTSDVDAAETITELTGEGTDQIRLQGTTDFSVMAAANFDEIEEINIAGAFTATFTGAQLTGETISLIGAEGVQEVVVNATAGNTTDLSGVSAGANWTAGIDTFIINGSSSADTITGSATDDIITGGAGADVINAGAGNNVITDAGVGEDQITHDANDSTVQINLTGSDRTELRASRAGATVTVSGSTITDRSIDAALSLGSVIIDGRALTTGNGAYIGGVGNDTIRGGGGDDLLVGETGADVLEGGAGNDAFSYYALRNLFVGNALEDLISGGEGIDSIQLEDTLSYTISAAHSWARASSVETFEQTRSNANNISITLNADAFTAGIRTVTLASDTNASGTNTINISAAIVGQDLTLIGSAGSDIMIGGAGNDTITGGNGDDRIAGGPGADSLTGGAGADTFFYDDGNVRHILENGTAEVPARLYLDLGISLFSAGNQITVTGVATQDVVYTVTAADTLDNNVLAMNLAAAVIAAPGSAFESGTVSVSGFAATITANTSGVTNLTVTSSVTSGDTGISLDTADVITDFTTATDEISVGITNSSSAVFIVDGTTYSLDDFIAAANNALNGTVLVYVAYNVEDTGNAYVAYDRNRTESFEAGDTFIVLNGVDSSSKIAVGDFVV